MDYASNDERRQAYLEMDDQQLKVEQLMLLHNIAEFLDVINYNMSNSVADNIESIKYELSTIDNTLTESLQNITSTLANIALK